ncbi:MAG TPA: alcohol dehydrogenase catalytic domain-containing protein [Thermoanaerobaculia bacterium]|nr:alcohol dehydrogenase catalytic domain-containing protein [Thermoanaerobaculia bacterium]
MNAAVIGASRQISIARVPVPRPAANEVRIAVEGSGVCASSLPLWQGRDWFHYPAAPGAPGHEGWGIIDAVGSDVRDLKRGQRVAFLSNNAFAELDVAPADGVVVLPAALDGRLFPGEAIACAMNAFRRSDIAAGQTVAVIGIGFLGAILVRLAADAGARVIAISRRKFALDLARDFGAETTIPLDEEPQVECDRVIEATGLQGPLDLAGKIVRERGRLIIAGYHQDGHRTVDMQLWNWKGLDVVNAHERERAAYVRGMHDAVDAVTSGRLDLDRLYTPHRFSNIEHAFRALEERPDGFVKAVVTI